MSPKGSEPSLEMKLTLPPARAAATAWLEPLPPGPSLNDWPMRVSPHAGTRSVRKARSATKLPITVTHFLFAADSAMDFLCSLRYGRWLACGRNHDNTEKHKGGAEDSAETDCFAREEVADDDGNHWIDVGIGSDLGGRLVMDEPDVCCESRDGAGDD